MNWRLPDCLIDDLSGWLSYGQHVDNWDEAILVARFNLAFL